MDLDPTVRAYATAELLLDRHGILTRGATAAEDVPGGFAAIYRVLGRAEEAGRVRRGYFVEGLGASQFGTTGAVTEVERGQQRRILTGLPSFALQGTPEVFGPSDVASAGTA